MSESETASPPPRLVGSGDAASPVLHRFLRKPADGSLPLCFDVPPSRLMLLHHPSMGGSRFLYNTLIMEKPQLFSNPGSLFSFDCVCSSSPELSVNGELSSESLKGFSKIVVHLKDLHIHVDSKEIVVQEGQTENSYSGESVITAGRCSSFIFRCSTCSKHTLAVSSLSSTKLAGGVLLLAGCSGCL